MEVISIMKKRYISLVLAACLFAGSTLTAQAEVIKGKDGWKAEFTGKEIESNFTFRLSQMRSSDYRAETVLRSGLL